MYIYISVLCTYAHSFAFRLNLKGERISYSPYLEILYAFVEM